MSAETDIAALTDGGLNTALKVRTALTSVLAVADSAFDGGTSGELNALTSKAAAVAADVLLIEDSAAGNAKKKVLRSGLYPFKDTPVGATALGINALAANTTGAVTAFGYYAGAANTTGAVTAFGYYAGAANTTGSVTAFGLRAGGANTTGKVTAFGVRAGQLNTTGVSTLLGDQTGYANTTGSVTAVGSRAAFAPAGVIPNASTTATYQTLIGQESGQASATQRNDVVAVGYRALIDAANTVALGANAQALHANSVALGDSIVTTAASQVAIGATHVEATKMTAPATPAAGDGRVYFDTADGSYKVKFDTGTVVTLATYA